jgi:hypothetical protein
MATNAGAAAATARIERLSSQANAALTQLSAARAAGLAARAEALRQLRIFQTLARQMQSDQASIGRWAHDAYVNGGPLADYMTFFQLLEAPTPAAAADPLAILRYVADARGRALDRLKGLTAAQREAADRAETASRQALAAEARASATKARLDTLLAQQKAALAAFQQAQADELGAVGTVRGALQRSHDPTARAADERLQAALRSRGGQVLTDNSTPCSSDTAPHPNGDLPASALCPLWGAPGQSLRPDAAKEFNAMSRAFERDTGAVLCVTDSYRSYAEQVAVSITRAGYAASPGRSIHGIGLAVDLCGGVESFAGAAHLWMEQHAALYGWFHPAWAEPTGVLPEPWHWEFAS